VKQQVAVIIGTGGMGMAIARRLGSGKSVLLVDGGVVASLRSMS
jgi:predicted dinucleotide-binding enzyme